MDYGCIGKKLSHSFSCEIHEKIGDYRYELSELTESEVPQFIQNKQFKGINVTVPFKKTVMPYLDVIDPNAQKIGAVNTVVVKDGKTYGYNTDFDGMKAMLLYSNISLKDKFVAILGSGGTATTAFHVASSSGAAKVVTVSRHKSADTVTYEELKQIGDRVQVIVNTTPVGMYPNIDDAVIGLEGFSQLESVVDAVYNPLSSSLVTDAKRKGIKSVGGLYMLVAQAVFSAEKFFNIIIDRMRILSIYDELLLQKRNIVLVGMPGSGKTTVAKTLSEKIGKNYLDTDEEIVKSTNISISDYFKNYGEKSFRQIEKETVKNISLLNGNVIATGGGVVIDEENMLALKKNGVVFFLDRPLEEITVSADRPLLQNQTDIDVLYQQRYELYRKYADFVVTDFSSVEKTVDVIMRSFYENIDY